MSSETNQAAELGGQRVGQLALIVLLVFTAWWRGHTLGPTVKQAFEVSLWPVVRGATEPLDCDEAAYGYIGRRLNRGAVLYRDVTENKPPLGYWTYAAGVGIGGANETAIRLLPMPFALATVALVFLITRVLGGLGPGCVAGFLAAILTTDPYLYGNGAQIEQFINFWSVGALGCGVKALGATGRRRLGWLFLCGLGIGAGSLVRQVVGVDLVLLAPLLVMWREAEGGFRARDAARDLQVLIGGFLSIWVVCGAVLVAQGAGQAAWDDIVRYGGALATDTPADPHAPSSVMRWLTGNADPSGRLPWPFGKTDYLVWWGTGSWPAWILGTAGLLGMALAGGRRERLVAAWSLGAWIQVALPGLYWAHYYLLVVPGLAIGAGVLVGRCAGVFKGRAGAGRKVVAGLVLAGGIVAIGATAWIQIRDYLGVPSEELTIRYKGGRQWVTLRELGRDLSRRCRVWENPQLLVWGWQSPLLFYSGLDSVTPHFFVDPLLKAYALEGRHPLIAPRLERVLRDVDARRPVVVFAGDPPFPGLLERLQRDYLPSRLVPRAPDGRGLWVRKDRYGEFEAMPP